MAIMINLARLIASGGQPHPRAHRTRVLEVRRIFHGSGKSSGCDVADTRHRHEQTAALVLASHRVVSDAHEGIKAAVSKVLCATWQRCRVHFMRNVLAHAGKSISPALGSVSNEDVEKICVQRPDRFAGLAIVDPSDRRKAVQTVEYYMAQGFKGVLIEPGLLGRPLAIDDRRLYPFYAHCEDRKVPVFIMAGGNAGPDADFTSPEHIDRVAADFPDLRLVSLHGSWPWVAQILHVCFRRPNVYVCPDMYLVGRMAGYEDYVRAANGFLAERLLFATSYPVIPLDRSVAVARELGLSDFALKRFLSENAIELLGFVEA
jgi:predicted TIM-barrel fold metal-dependent hydrolase